MKDQYAHLLEGEVSPEIMKEVEHYWQVYKHLSRQYEKKEIKEIEFENKAKEQADNTMERIILLDDTYTKKDIFNLIMRLRS